MTIMLKDLKTSCFYKPEHIYNCSSCGAIIKNHVAKRFYFAYSAGGALCMTCLFKLHLELNDLFEQAPGLSRMMMRVVHSQRRQQLIERERE